MNHEVKKKRYKHIILTDKYRLSLQADIPPRVRVVGRVGYVSISEPTGSDNRQLSDKVRTLYEHFDIKPIKFVVQYHVTFKATVY
jgi:hypothetical protein